VQKLQNLVEAGDRTERAGRYRTLDGFQDKYMYNFFLT
jgi:hypothetical protein